MKMTRAWPTLLLLAAAAPAAAQQWDNPSFFSPRPGSDIGLYVIKADHADAGVEGIWRQTGNINLGVRLGVGGTSEERIVLIGAEFFGPLNITGVESPLLLAWGTGIGAGFDDVTTLRIPLGISIGARLEPGPNVSILPYVHPRIALDYTAFDVGDDEVTDTELDFDVDVGADVALGDSFTLRVGASLGDIDTFGIGLAYKLQRRVVVR